MPLIILLGNPELSFKNVDIFHSLFISRLSLFINRLSLFISRVSLKAGKNRYLFACMDACMHKQTQYTDTKQTDTKQTLIYRHLFADWYSKVFLCLQVERLIYLGAGINMYVLTDMHPIFTTMYNHFVWITSTHNTAFTTLVLLVYWPGGNTNIVMTYNRN